MMTTMMIIAGPVAHDFWGRPKTSMIDMFELPPLYFPAKRF